jgi:type I restriction enzyme S subunit
MMSVELVRVGEVLRLERREVQIAPDVEYCLIGVYSFGKGILHREPKPGVELGDYRFFRIEPGDLVLSNIQAWEGAIALAADRDTGTIGTHRFLSYVPIADRIDTNWARWFFLSETGMQLIRRAAPGTAVRNRTLAVKRFEDLVIPLPPIEDQLRVAAQLDRIRVAAERAEHLADRGRTISDAFGTACASRPDILDADKQRRGWRRARLDEVMTRASDPVSVDPDASYPNLGIYSFGRGLFAKPPIEGSTTSAKTLFRVHSGQFIYSRLFAFEGAYGFVTDEFDGFFVSSEFPSFDVDPTRIDARWLASYLRTRERWMELAATSTGLGVRRQRVPVESLLAYEVWLPPIDEQHAMVRAIDRLAAVSHARAAVDLRVDSLVPAALNREFTALT